MHYKKLLQDRYHSELKRISMLKKIELKFRRYPIVWRNLHLPKFQIGLKKAQYCIMPPYKDLMHITGPVVYYYRITKGKPETIRASLCDYKKKIKRVCPSIWDVRYSSILYVGSETKNFARRTVEHFGLAHKDTSGLQLLHWAPETNVTLSLYYSQIDPKYKDVIRHVEAVLAKHLNPIIGRSEK